MTGENDEHGHGRSEGEREMKHETMEDVMHRAVRDVERGQSTIADRAARDGAVVRFEVPSGVAIEEGRDTEGCPRVALRAPDGTLVLEYHPGQGRCRVHAPRVEIEADDEMRLAGRSVRVEAERELTLRAADAAVVLRRGGVGLLADELSGTARQISWSASSTIRVAADVVETRARRLAEHADEVETRARVLVEKTRQSFREAEELAQTHARRLRMVAEDTVRVLGRRTLFKAREDMKLRGERIYLD